MIKNLKVEDAALLEEMIQLERLPGCVDLIPRLKTQLITDKAIAQIEIQLSNPKVWNFSTVTTGKSYVPGRIIV